MTDIIALDNALVDILVQVDDETLTEFGFQKGMESFLSKEQLESFVDKLPTPTIMPGGAAANTLSTASKLGSSVSFIGKVGQDMYGQAFEEALKIDTIKSYVTKAKGHTGRLIAFITPDGERTFALHLGLAPTISTKELPLKAIANAKIFYFTGYLLEDPALRETAFAALDHAKKNKTLIAFDMADPGFVDRNRDTYFTILKEYADIVYANEDEAAMFANTSPREALDVIGDLVEIAIVKIGAQGSWIKKGNETFHIKAQDVDVLDTTGAGDAYAAGFLHAFLKGKTIEQAGALGSILGSAMVSQIGARFSVLPPDAIQLM